MTKSTLNVFIGFFNAVFYIFVLLAAIVVIVEVSRLVRKSDTETYALGSIDPNQLLHYIPEKHDVTSISAGIQNAQINTSAWNITFDTAEISVKLLMSLTAILRTLYVLVIMFTLRSFVLSLKEQEAFTIQNISRIQRLGILLILIEPLQWISRLLRRQWIIDHFDIQFANRSLAYRIGYTFGAGEFVWNWVLAGLLVLVISVVFKQGVKLKEEVDLTV